MEGVTRFSLSMHTSHKCKGLPQQAWTDPGIPGMLRHMIFLTFSTTRVVGRQPYAQAAFTPREILVLNFRGWVDPRAHGSIGNTQSCCQYIPYNHTTCRDLYQNVCVFGIYSLKITIICRPNDFINIEMVCQTVGVSIWLTQLVKQSFHFTK